MIFINKKYTLVAFLGLGISLSLVSTSLIFLYSFQYDAFNTYVVEHPQEQITISLSDTINTYGNEENVIPDLNSYIDDALLHAHLGGKTTFRG